MMTFADDSDALIRGAMLARYSSATRHFRYWDDEKNAAGYRVDESQRTQKLNMSIDEFIEQSAAACAKEMPSTILGVEATAVGASLYCARKRLCSCRATAASPS